MTYRTITLLLGLGLSGGLNAVPLFDQDVTPDVIFGSGNANGAFTVDQNNGIELGLRAKLRHNASGAPENTFNSDGAGTYTFDAGVAPTQSFPTAVWSFEWSITSNYDGTSGYNLDDLTYELSIVDNAGTAGSVTFDPINDINPGTSAVQWDHAIGDNSTNNGAGVSISNSVSAPWLYAARIGTSNVAQNSWKTQWFLSGFDPNATGTYDFSLTAFDSSGIAIQQLAQTQITVAAVPEPSTLAALSFGVVGTLLWLRRRRAAAKAA